MVSIFDAKVGYSGVSNSSDLQFITCTSSESTVKNTFLWFGLYPQPITLSVFPHSAFSDLKISLIPGKEQNGRGIRQRILVKKIRTLICVWNSPACVSHHWD